MPLSARVQLGGKSHFSRCTKFTGTRNSCTIIKPCLIKLVCSSCTRMHRAALFGTHSINVSLSFLTGILRGGLCGYLGGNFFYLFVNFQNRIQKRERKVVDYDMRRRELEVRGTLELGAEIEQEV